MGQKNMTEAAAKGRRPKITRSRFNYIWLLEVGFGRNAPTKSWFGSTRFVRSTRSPVCYSSSRKGKGRDRVEEE